MLILYIRRTSEWFPFEVQVGWKPIHYNFVRQDTFGFVENQIRVSKLVSLFCIQVTPWVHAWCDVTQATQKVIAQPKQQ